MNNPSKESLAGKWLLVKNTNDHMVPNIPILEFDGDEISLYDFDKKQETVLLKQALDFQFIDENRMENTSDDIDISYVRLLPTETELTESEIEKLEFDISWNNEKVKIIFNQELERPEILEVMQIKELRNLKLERIDSTLFLSFYRLGERELVLPIKKVTADSLEVYGFHKAPFYVTSN